MLGFTELLQSLESNLIFLFILCIFIISTFEFVNGFHDTANAVATVIYTKSLKPHLAILLSGTLNFLGVLTSSYFFGMKVAMGIVKLLPLTELYSQGVYENIALAMAVLISALVWNFGTWFFGIPCSSTHSLIGALLGGGLGFQIVHSGNGVNWSKAGEIAMSLLLSPTFGFTFSIILIYIVQKILKKKNIFKENNPNGPKWGIRAVLISTCSLVSFFHGSNDGQKGIGLIMIILLAFAPMKFALNEEFGNTNTINHLNNLSETLSKYKSTSSLEKEFDLTILNINDLKNDIQNNKVTTTAQKFEIRKRLQNIIKSLELIVKDVEFLPNESARSEIKKDIKILKNYIEFAPLWAFVLVALSIGIGTMVGWKRIAVTIGEKIGKSHLSYGQGAVSEVVAASTIGLSSSLGLPVSTTHVLSSAIAGSMVAKGGTKNLQKRTIINIGLAWILTLPVTIILAFVLYLLFRLII